VIAVLAVDRPAHRIHHQAARHRLGFDPRVQARFRIERALRAAIGDELDCLEEAATANVADVRMRAKRRTQSFREPGPLMLHRVEQTVALDHFLHCERRRAADRMAE
jgi:hypothetical protein